MLAIDMFARWHGYGRAGLTYLPMYESLKSTLSWIFCMTGKIKLRRACYREIRLDKIEHRNSRVDS